MRHVIDLVYPTNASIRKFESVEVIKREIIIAISATVPQEYSLGIAS